MIFSKIIFVSAVYTNLFHAVVARNNGGFNSTSSAAAATSIAANVNAGNSNNNGASASVNGGSSLTLDANAVQTGSQSNGLVADDEAGQAASATDNANFINFCSGKTLTNGQQLASGSCNGIVMGDIPSSSNMISSIITNPGPGDTIPANQAFTVNVQVANLVAGSFTNPNTTYYAAPQALEGGKVVGHTHITIQSLGDSLAATTPPDASTFAFFKGIDDAGNGNGGLNATVAEGLPPGAYRVCTLTSASNHQPVTMPLAQRGAQDDCNKFTVTNGGTSNANSGSTTSSAATNNDNNGSNACSAAGAASTGTGNANSNNSTSSAATNNGNNGSNTSGAAGAASTSTGNANSNNGTSSTSNSDNNGAGGNRNEGGDKNRGGRKRFVLREFIA